MNATTEPNLIKAADFLPVLDNVIGFMTDALAAHDAAITKIAQLEAKLADKEKVILEKVATPTPPVPPPFQFREEAVRQTLDALRELNIIDAGLQQKYAADIKQDPHAILPLLVKVSNALIEVPYREGMGVAKEAAAQSAGNDPDGWDAFALGRPVKLIK